MNLAHVERRGNLFPIEAQRRLKVFRRPLLQALGAVLLSTTIAASWGVSRPPHQSTGNSEAADIGLPAIVMAHGVDASPETGLPGKLKQLFQEQRYEVYAPQLPLGKDQRIDPWTETVLESAEEAGKKGKAFGVGFSGGTQPILQVVYSRRGAFCGILLVSTSKQGNIKPLYRGYNDPARIMVNVGGNAGIVHAKNDPILPFSGAEALSRETGIPILEQDQDGGHFINLPADKLAQKALKMFNHAQALIAKCQN